MEDCSVDKYSMSNIKICCIAVISNFAMRCLCEKKIAATELVKIIIVVHQGETRANIWQVRHERFKDNRLFFIEFLTSYLFFRYYL